MIPIYLLCVFTQTITGTVFCIEGSTKETMKISVYRTSFDYLGKLKATKAFPSYLYL